MDFAKRSLGKEALRLMGWIPAPNTIALNCAIRALTESKEHDRVEQVEGLLCSAYVSEAMSWPSCHVFHGTVCGTLDS